MGDYAKEAHEKGQQDGAAGGYTYSANAWGDDSEAYKAGWMSSKAQHDVANGKTHSYDGNATYHAAATAAREEQKKRD